MPKRAAWSLIVLVVLVGIGFPTAAAQEAPDRAAPTASPPASEDTVPTAAATPAAGGLELPGGWSVQTTARGTTLRYRLEQPLPVRASRPEFRSGRSVLGHPDLVADTLVLPLDDAIADILAGPDPQLSLWLGAQRIDAPATARELPGASDEPFRSFGPHTPLPIADDPGRPGPYRTRTSSYALDPLPYRAYAEPLEVVGEVTLPIGAPGPRPLVLFLHGRHATCFTRGQPFSASLEWPCSAGTLPIPSHEGYRYITELLASQGYITVSISANAVNAQDFRGDAGAGARSALIRHHLGLFARWSTRGGDPVGGRLRNAVDMDRVVLVGHSRGGEGVERATVDASRADPFTIVGLADIAPTAFGRQTAAGVTRAVLLPYCDGDVSDLQGQTYVDTSRDLADGDRSLRAAVMILGANHNFFNTEWTPGQAQAPAGDDWEFVGNGAKACDPTQGQRLSARRQQRVGATYVAALVAVATQRDAEAASLLDGSAVRARSAGSAQVLTHAIGANRTTLFEADLAALTGGLGVDSRICDGVAQQTPTSGTECAGGVDPSSLPHWLPFGFGGGLPRVQAWDVRWRRAGPDRNARVTFAASDLRFDDSLELRIAADPRTGPARFAVRISDANGATTTIDDNVRIVPLPGRNAPLAKLWAQTVRLPLNAANGVDLSQVTSVEIVPLSTDGRLFILDGHAWNPGVPRAQRVWLPRVSLGTRTIREGDDGRRTVDIPLKVRGTAAGGSVVYASISSGRGQPQIRRIPVSPGTTPTVRVTVEGDTVWQPGRQDTRIILLAGPGTTTGRYSGQIRVREDDPAPTITFSVPETVEEGDVLRVQATLSAPIPDRLFYTLRFRPSRGGLPAIDTDDLSEDFLIAWFGGVPDPPMPFGFGGVFFRRNRTTAVFDLPIRADDVLEGDEGIDVVVRPARRDPLLDAPLRFGVRIVDAAP